MYGQEAMLSPTAEQLEIPNGGTFLLHSSFEAPGVWFQTVFQQIFIILAHRVDNVYGP